MILSVIRSATLTRLSLLPLANLVLAGLAVAFAPASRPDQYFRETELITWLNSVELSLAGLLGCLIWERSSTVVERRANRFWLLAGLFLAYLGADEFLQYHEHFGLWLTRNYGLHAPRLIGPIDNAILLLYACFGLCLALVYRRHLVANRQSLALLVLGGLAMAASQATDQLTSGIMFSRDSGVAFLQAQAVEESLKFVSTGFLVAATVSELLFGHRPGRTVAPAPLPTTSKRSPAVTP